MNSQQSYLSPESYKTDSYSSYSYYPYSADSSNESNQVIGYNGYNMYSNSLDLENSSNNLKFDLYNESYNNNQSQYDINYFGYYNYQNHAFFNYYPSNIKKEDSFDKINSNLLLSNSSSYQSNNSCNESINFKIKEPTMIQSTPLYQNNINDQDSTNVIQKHSDILIKPKPRNILNEIQYLDEPKQKKRYRTAFTTQQRYYLLQIFERSFYPSREVLEEAARHLNVTVGNLQTWFKNIRSKQKKLKNFKAL